MCGCGLFSTVVASMAQATNLMSLISVPVPCASGSFSLSLVSTALIFFFICSGAEQDRD